MFDRDEHERERGRAGGRPEWVAQLDLGNDERAPAQRLALGAPIWASIGPGRGLTLKSAGPGFVFSMDSFKLRFSVRTARADGARVNTPFLRESCNPE